ncbi:MAG: FtsX-like permease family protein, partial [Oscillospiraceae bacterium]|nr:FtsX-like permease family protein [Oscillospiraceae bacterium]
IASIEKGKLYLMDRSVLPNYVGYEQDSDRMDALGNVFPLLFFIVAALVCLTTMTRMVEEQRTQIGVLKAVGYGTWAVAQKFLIYGCTAAIIGCVIGCIIGTTAIPWIICTCYAIMYTLPAPVLAIHWGTLIGVAIASVGCTVLAVLWAVWASVVRTPAALMRPKAPKAGKRILLERITPLWQRMSFSAKVSARNLLRYKKRFFMTIVGISGCTALLVTGFGLSDSINEIMDKQYAELNHYDVLMVLKNAKFADSEPIRQVMETHHADSVLPVHRETLDISANDKTYEADLFIPKDLDSFPQHMTLRNRKTGNMLTLDNETVILTEKAAETMGLSVGDSLKLIKDSGKTVLVKIGGIAENYVGSYVYMSPAQYEKLFQKSPNYRMLLAKLGNTADGTDFAEAMLDCEGVTTISLVEEMKQSFHNMVTSINYIIVVLIISAGLLAFVVLYNLMNINITERERELATIKVLGFYEGEVGAYVFRETLILSLLGSAAGLVLGIFLHGFVVRTAEVDMAIFGREIAPSSFVYALILTMVFSFIVCLAMLPKLRRISMVESLKSVD